MPVDHYPVNDDITLIDTVDIYNTNKWWKAAVKYHIGETDPVVAIYLWYNDDGEWVRKNKYTIKSPEAWLMDRELVRKYLSNEESSTAPSESFPVSDYYHVADGETVVKSDEWWKAIVVIDRKGDYSTHEIMIYLWQRENNRWFRRQKYSIKDAESWADDRIAVERLLDIDDKHSLSDTSVSEELGGSLIINMAEELGISIDGSDPTELMNKLEITHVEEIN